MECENTDTHLGYRRWRPRWMQRFATAKTFVIFMCLLTLVESMMLVGYTSSVLTSIERRFHIKSAEAGLIVSAYEVGNFLVVAFVSYLGGRPGSHRPKWVGFGAFIMSVAALIFTLPHLLGDQYTPGRVTFENDTDIFLCRNITIESIESHDDSDKPVVDPAIMDVTVYYDCMEGDGNPSNYMFFFVVAQLMLGMGAAPMFTLGVTYVDDNIGAAESASYIGIVYCVTAIGPALGFLLGGLCVSYYVDVGSVSPEDVHISPGDPQWVGAWWIGYLICGFLITLFALPVLAYPRTLRRSRDQEGDNKTKCVSEGVEEDKMVHMQFDCSSCREFLQALKRLLTNPTYLLINVVASMELSIVTGFVYFMPKFLETQFGTTSSKANIITGVIIPPAAIGIIVGGIIVRRFNFTLEKCTRFAFIVGFITLIVLSSIFLVKCDNQEYASVPQGTNSQMNTSSCFRTCDCHNDYKPICGVNGVTYFSACHAGCRNHRYDDVLNQVFIDCACISGNSDDVSWDARNGKCESSCDRLPMFMSVVIVVVFVTAITQIPILMATLRSVYERDRPFALGIQFVFLRVLAYIPAPIYAGKTIDSACLIWQTLCEGVGSCFEYQKTQFHANYIGLCVGLKTLAVAFSLLCWLSCRYTCRCCQHRDFTRLSPHDIRLQEKKNDPQELVDDLDNLQEVPVEIEMSICDLRPRLQLLTTDANI